MHVVGDTARRVVYLQITTGLLAAAGFFMAQGIAAAQAALYGGLISVISTLLLSHGVKRAGDAAPQSAKKSMIILYVSAVQRFVLVLVAFAVGLAVLKLTPIAVFVGFVVTQLSYVISMRGLMRKNNGS